MFFLNNESNILFRHIQNKNYNLFLECDYTCCNPADDSNITLCCRNIGNDNITVKVNITCLLDRVKLTERKSQNEIKTDKIDVVRTCFCYEHIAKLVDDFNFIDHCCFQLEGRKKDI